MAGEGDTAPTKNGPNTPCSPAKHEKALRIPPYEAKNFPGLSFCIFFCFFAISRFLLVGGAFILNA